MQEYPQLRTMQEYPQLRTMQEYPQLTRAAWMLTDPFSLLQVAHRRVMV